uniref:Uncharacterized protein n=1 Tax=Anguilla anguilla TaxID=7936 RepID=A0A0E9R3M4_ANGAN
MEHSTCSTNYLQLYICITSVLVIAYIYYV